MDKMKSKKIYNRGLFTGAVVGILATLLIVTLVIGLLLPKLDIGGDDIPELTIGDDVTDKMNMLLSYVDYLYLFDYDEEEMADYVYKGIMESLGDPYSVYYTAEEYSDLMESTSGTYYGIGVVVSQDPDTGAVEAVLPYEGAPGDLAGIQAGDMIIAVDEMSITGMDLDLVVDMIRGEQGTTVTLTVLRDEETLDIVVTRDEVKVVTVGYEMLEDNIGYISVSQFDGVTTDQFATAMDDLIEQGMTGLIVDIRNNPGGRLDVVTDMLDTLLPEGVIVYTEDKNGNRVDYNSDSASILNVPMAILVNGNSASASEIFSGAMQDYDLAEIIGEQTFGKGIVQSIIPFEDNSAIKITVENYFTPKGNNIHGIGITPDEIVELDEDKYLEEGIDTQLQVGIEYILNQK